jgi:hypothetical protein
MIALISQPTFLVVFEITKTDQAWRVRVPIRLVFLRYYVGPSLVSFVVAASRGFEGGGSFGPGCGQTSFTPMWPNIRMFL